MRNTWTVTDTAVRPSDIVPNDLDVVEVFWSCTAFQQSANTSATAAGSTKLLPIKNAQARVPFNKLSKKQLLQWCFDTSLDRVGIEAQLEAEIKAIVSPATQRSLPPWKGADANDLVT